MIAVEFRVEQRACIISRTLTPLVLLAVFFCGALAAGGQDFFPKGIFYPDNPQLDSSVAKWYSEQLTALHEPSLFSAKQDSTVQSYRFLWLRTFHRPIAVRILIHPDGSGTVVTKMADGAGGYKPGKPSVDKTEVLTPDTVKNIIAKIQRLQYWALPERDPKRSGFDGARWVIEGVDHGRYRLVDRWSPKDGPIRELGLYFVRDLARLDLKNEPIY